MNAGLVSFSDSSERFSQADHVEREVFGGPWFHVSCCEVREVKQSLVGYQREHPCH